MFDWLVETFTSYPYVGVAVVFFICGLGFPLPEEIVMVAAGYVCFAGLADLAPMVATCFGAILCGDLVPFLLGRIFGVRLLRIRPMRILVNRRRLSSFDRWFRKRGDLVIFFARFLPGLRIVAYFAAGTMRMSVARFILLDVIGIAVVVPIFVGIGYSSGEYIDEAIAKVTQIEQAGLILSGAAILGLILWLILRRRRGSVSTSASETYVGPSVKASNHRPESEPNDTNSESQ